MLEKSKPNLVIACYGMNCGIYRPVSEHGFNAYKAGIQQLKSKAEKAGAQIIFVTPPYYDDHGKSKSFNYADTLATYSGWLVGQREHGWNVIDLNTEMTQSIHARQVLQPSYTTQGDRVHPNALGHRIMAESLTDWFSSPPTAATEVLIRQHETPPGLRALINKRMQLLRDAWLTETKHKRPGVRPGLPMDQANVEAAKLTQKINTAVQK